MSFAQLENTNILITGGAGFVASNLCRLLCLEVENLQIYLVDNLLSSEQSNILQDPRVKLLEGSIADDELLGRLPKALHYVFHLACYHGNQSSIANPLEDHANNTLTSLKLFEHLSQNRSLRKVVYAAAGCAVAEKTFEQASATVEDAPVSLYHDSPYSISKLIGELYANYYFRQCNFPVVKARFQNVYGPWEVLGAGKWRGTRHTVWRNVIPTFIWKALHQEPLPVENGGIATRDFIYVKDLVLGLVCCALNGNPGEVYNLATGIETSIAQLATLINDLTNNPSGTGSAAARTWDNSGKRFGSTEKSKQEIGFIASTAIDDGLTQTIDWTKRHKQHIRTCMLNHADMVPEVKDY